jgi:hypothetical protein
MKRIRILCGPDKGKVYLKDDVTCEIAVNAKVAEFVKEEKAKGETKELKTVKNTKGGRKGNN